MTAPLLLLYGCVFQHLFGSQQERQVRGMSQQIESSAQYLKNSVYRRDKDGDRGVDDRDAENDGDKNQCDLAAFHYILIVLFFSEIVDSQYGIDDHQQIGDLVDAPNKGGERAGGKQAE